MTSTAPIRRSLKGLLRGRLVAPPRLTLAEWSDRYRYLSPESSAEPGKWDTARAPYQRGIMDACSDPLIPDVVVMTSAQVGKTETLLNAVGYYADQDPAPILVVQPTLEMAKAWSQDRLAPMIRDTPRIRAKFPPAKSRSPENAILHKTFGGGRLTVIGANSPSGLSGRPIRVVLLDEVDRYPASAGTEGDPVTLAEKRQQTFRNRKTIKTSTPTRAGISRIARDFERSDQRHFWVPCPGCGGMQTLRWAQLSYEGHDPKTACYVCVYCKRMIREEEKYAMLLGGEWRAKEEFRGVAGFFLNALYSPWAPWADLVGEWLRVQGNPEELMVFVNTVLAEVWEERGGDAVPMDPLLERREEYAECPAGVGVITAGVDVQGDRLEALVVGWGLGEESWRLAYDTIRGDTSREDVWNTLDLILKRKFGGLPIAAVGVDSGFRTDEVYRFVAPRQRGRVWAFKGIAGAGKHLLGRPAKSNRAGVKVFPVGTDTAKDTLFARLKHDAPGPGYLHFATWLEPEYFAQLTSEAAITKRVAGRTMRTYVKRQGVRNEALDLEVYALAALVGLGDGIRRNLGTLAARRAPKVGESVPIPPDTPAIERVRTILAPKRRGGFATRF